MSHISEQDAGSNASDSSKANWLSARKSVLSHGVTRGFKTLRDMHSVDIVPFGDLELVSTLGGARPPASFRVVGRCAATLTPALSACVSFF